jgi:phospholipid/cholesterol/gamma-HCH transport system substrate-binding protein
MSRSRRDLVRVGIFTLVSVGILVASLLWLAGSSLLRPRDTYRVLFDSSVSGLSAGAQVEYQGVVVGRVRDIRLTGDIPPKVSVIVDLHPKTPVRRDTEAALLGSLVTNIQYIELQGGSVGAGPLQPGGVIEGRVPSLVDLQKRVAQAADLGLTILTRLERDIFTERNAANLTGLIDDLGAVAGQLRAVSDMLRSEHGGADVARMVARMTRAADIVEDVFSDLYTRRGDIYASLRDTATGLHEVLEALDAFMAEARAALGREPGITGLMERFAAVLRRMQETLDVVEADPSVLLRGRTIPERELPR